jgi:hypothetical protein
VPPERTLQLGRLQTGDGILRDRETTNSPEIPQSQSGNWLCLTVEVEASTTEKPGALRYAVSPVPLAGICAGLSGNWQSHRDGVIGMGIRGRTRMTNMESFYGTQISPHLYHVAIHRGMFPDKIIDRFIVDNGLLIEVCSGQALGFNVDCKSNENGFGGWGLLNSSVFPE